MIEVKLQVSPHPYREGATNQETSEFTVMRNGEAVMFESCPHQILEIPEDYYLELFIAQTVPNATSIVKPQSPRVEIGDVSLFCRHLGMPDNNTIYWQVAWVQEVHARRPFYRIPGRHVIKVVIPNADDSMTEYRFFVEVLAAPDSVHEISSMLKTIDTDYNEIDSLCINNNLANESSFSDLLDNAEDIYKNLSAQWQLLLLHMRKSLAPQMVIKPNGVPNSPEAIHWLCANTEALGYCQPDEQDFVINNFPMHTDYAAEEVVAPVYDLFENRVILGFLAQIQVKLGDALNTLVRKHICRQVNEEVAFAGYMRFSKIIEEYSGNMLNDLSARIHILQQNFQRLYLNFKKVTGIAVRVSPVFPKITPFVARTKVYFDIFTMIQNWYRICRERTNLNDFVMHFIKMDKLYEFTVLTKIVHAVKDLGGANELTQWHDMQSPCFGGSLGERPENEPFNYYRWLFPENEFTMELWYEPLIRRYEESQEGELAVVGNSQKSIAGYYLTPDFLFRIYWPQYQQTDYIVMDAKNCSNNTVIDKEFPKLLPKYYFGLNLKSKDFPMNPIKAVWALYSRGSTDSVSPYIAQHKVTGEYAVFPSLEGVRLGVNDFELFRKYLNALISHLRKLHSTEALARKRIA